MLMSDSEPSARVGQGIIRKLGLWRRVLIRSNTVCALRTLLQGRGSRRLLSIRFDRAAPSRRHAMR
jgi:hypothetical protein